MSNSPSRIPRRKLRGSASAVPAAGGGTMSSAQRHSGQTSEGVGGTYLTFTVGPQTPRTRQAATYATGTGQALKRKASGAFTPDSDDRRHRPTTGGSQGAPFPASGGPQVEQNKDLPSIEDEWSGPTSPFMLSPERLPMRTHVEAPTPQRQSATSRANSQVGAVPSLLIAHAATGQSVQPSAIPVPSAAKAKRAKSTAGTAAGPSVRANEGVEEAPAEKQAKPPARRGRPPKDTEPEPLVFIEDEDRSKVRSFVSLQLAKPPTLKNGNVPHLVNAIQTNVGVQNLQEMYELRQQNQAIMHLLIVLLRHLEVPELGEYPNMSRERFTEIFERANGLSSRAATDVVGLSDKMGTMAL